MNQPRGVEHTGLAGPYLKLVGEVFSPEVGKHDENGFIAVSRGDFRSSIAQKHKELVGSQTRIPGDEQLLAILDRAVKIRTVSGLAVLTRPSAGSLLESLRFRTFESPHVSNDGAERLSDPINDLDAILTASSVRLSVIHMFSYSYERSPLNPDAAVEIQQAENEAPEEMRELGMGHPGEQPFTLNYLIKFD